MSGPLEATDLKVGRHYADDHDRELEITVLQLGDRAGREILGLLSHSPRNGHRPQSYSCDQTIFASTWRLINV